MSAGVSSIKIFREWNGDEAWSTVFVNVGQGIFTFRDRRRFGQ
jgi:hypothetical protein